MMYVIVAIATGFTVLLWWILELIRTDEKAIRIKFGKLGRKGRRLGLYEEFLWTAQNAIGYGINVNAVVMESSVDIKTSHIRQALDALWRRHPLLRCSIITISKGKSTMNYFTEIAGKPSYDFQMVPSIDWKDTFQEELRNRFASCGPQWRVKVTLPRRENDRYVFPFIFTFNSCIVDDMSFIEGVVKDFQRFLTRAVYPECTFFTNISLNEDVTDSSLGDVSEMSMSVNSAMSDSIRSAMSDSIRSAMSDSASSAMDESITSSLADSVSGALSDSPGQLDLSKTTTNSNDSADAITDVSSASDVTKKSSSAKVRRLLPARESIYRELNPGLYVRLLLPIVNRIYHKPFLSTDPVSVEIRTHLKPSAAIRQAGVSTFRLDEVESKSFIQECNANSVTITSALTAAATVSLQDLLRSKAFHGNKPLTCRCVLHCNMRNTSEAEVPEISLGNHEDMVDFVVSLPKSSEITQSIWKQAKGSNYHIQKHLKSRTFSWSCWQNGYLRRKHGVRNFLSAIAKNPSSKSYCFSIRDRGEYKVDISEPNCHVREVYSINSDATVSLSVFSIGAVLIDGQLCVSVGYDRQCVDSVIGEEFTELLRQGLGGKGALPEVSANGRWFKAPLFKYLTSLKFR